MIHWLRVERSDNGIAFAILKGERPEEYSSTEALVTFNPFGNTASPNMLVRAEFIREVAYFANIRDGQGKLKPVIMLAAPGVKGSKLKLSKEERKEIKKGELGPAAKELLHAVSEKGIGRIALLGFSQGADVALAGARTGYSANLDVEDVSIGDPAGVKDRNPLALGRDFAKAAPGLEAAANRTGLRVLRPAREVKGEFSRFYISAIQPINSMVIAKALGVNSFESRMQEILDEGKVNNLVVGYGAESTISNPKDIEPAMARLYERNGEEAFTSIKVEGGTHAWGDQLTLLAKLYMRALA